MPTAAAQRLADRLLPVLVGGTVFAFAAGSSSVSAALRLGHPLRWVILIALVAVAAWNARLAMLPVRAGVAATVLVGLALLSTLWSVEPKTTFERACTLALLFAACLLLAARPAQAYRIYAGILGGAAAVGLAGLLELALTYHRAVVAATYESPARYRGFGQDPNTVALLFGVTTPLAVWGVLTGKRRALAVACLVLFAGSIIGSGSRGGLAAAAVGSLVVVACALRGRSAVAALLAVVVVAAVGAGIQAVPKTSTASVAPVAPVVVAPTPKPGYLDAEARYPLDSDVGRPLPGGGEPPVQRSFFSSSGRLAAWRGAAHEAARRPVVGHGFGTEQNVFIDRYYSFVGGLPENSYIGLALQLGAVGLIALAALVGVLAGSGLRVVGRHDLAVAAGLGVLAAGLVAGFVQSYLTSVGNIAAVALWVPAFLLAGLGRDG